MATECLGGVDSKHHEGRRSYQSIRQRSRTQSYDGSLAGRLQDHAMDEAELRRAMAAVERFPSPAAARSS